MGAPPLGCACAQTRADGAGAAVCVRPGCRAHDGRYVSDTTWCWCAGAAATGSAGGGHPARLNSLAAYGSLLLVRKDKQREDERGGREEWRGVMRERRSTRRD